MRVSQGFWGTREHWQNIKGNKGTLANFWEQGNKIRKITVRKHSENLWEHGNIGQFWKGTMEQGAPWETLLCLGLLQMQLLFTKDTREELSSLLASCTMEYTQQSESVFVQMTSNHICLLKQEKIFTLTKSLTPTGLVVLYDERDVM